MLWHYVGAAAVAAAVGFAAGWRVQGWRWSAADAERVVAQAEADRLARVAADRAAGTFEARREAIRVEQRVITREVDRVVDRPVYRDGVCLDADGLRLVAAAAGAPASAAEPGPAMPASDAAR